MKKKTAGRNLTKVHAKRKKSTKTRVKNAVELLEKEGRYVTFSLVAEVAGVSRPTLYNHPDLKTLIERKKAEQHNAVRRLGSKMRADAKTIEELRRKNGKLRKTIQRQGDLIEVLNDTGPVLRDKDVAKRI